mmetsp:Transcript_97438/g.279993  ORF Transcript_97438/g.279993 Transcript_97438/m.279993 type:complete len:248 (-) Transcript_97438:368-1111(-)
MSLSFSSRWCWDRSKCHLCVSSRCFLPSSSLDLLCISSCPACKPPISSRCFWSSASSIQALRCASPCSFFETSKSASNFERLRCAKSRSAFSRWLSTWSRRWASEVSSCLRRTSRRASSSFSSSARLSEEWLCKTARCRASNSLLACSSAPLACCSLPTASSASRWRNSAYSRDISRSRCLRSASDRASCPPRCSCSICARRCVRPATARLAAALSPCSRSLRSSCLSFWSSITSALSFRRLASDSE